MGKLASVKHRGEKVDQAIRNSGLSITEVAEKMQHSRNTLYRRLEDPNLSWDYILKVYKIIRRDPIDDFPEIKKTFLKGYYDDEAFNEVSSINDHQNQELQNCKEQLAALKEKYIEVLEENRTLRNRQTG